MKNNTLWKIQLYLGIMMAIVMAIGILIAIRNYQSEDGYAYYNRARTLVADQLQWINQSYSDGGFEANSYQANGNKEDRLVYPFVVSDRFGKIVYSEKEEYKHLDTVNLNEFIQVDQSLYYNDQENVKVSFVLVKNQSTVGFVAFFVPRKEVVGRDKGEKIVFFFLPILICIGIDVMIYVFYLWYMKQRMVDPVKEMIASSKAIIDGDYSISVVKTKSTKLSSNEIDHLAYQFELMRDELMEKRRREEELNKSQKELISCISHDLKTPISTIKAYGEGLRDGLAKEPEKIQRYAEVIVSKSEVLTKMIHDLLEHSNAELHQLSIEKKEQYFNPYIERVAKELEGLVTYHKMTFHFLNTAPNLLVAFDENRITQVIANLIDNSIKYSQAMIDIPFDSSKRVGTVSLQIKYQAEKHQLLISVRDNGKGIGVTDIPFVFDKFYRGEKSRTTSVSGSGLGLSICKYIVKEHGGEIQCESKLEQGTVFTFTLPV